MAGFSVSGQYLVEAENKFEHWLKDRSYLSLIAALDMFFYRFPRHNMALLRAGTQVSRYKHCAVLDAISRLCRETGLKRFELFQWIFFRRAADELPVIHKGGQELFEGHSYAPYISDLGLSRRSPFSATANPFLHYWCNAASTLLGSSKSAKSIIPCDVDFSGATVNAMVLAYATEVRPGKSRLIFFTSQAEAKRCSERLLESKSTPRGHGEMPNAFEAAQWYQYLSEKSFIIDREISRSTDMALRDCCKEDSAVPADDRRCPRILGESKSQSTSRVPVRMVCSASGIEADRSRETISPWDLLSITEQAGPDYLINTETTDVDNLPDRTGLFALLVCIYRLLVARCLGGRRDYIQRLRDDNLKRILRTFRCSSQYLERAEREFGHWIRDRSYLSLVAALDMFLNRFGHHDMAVLRAGSHVSRYKHCAVLDDIARLCKATGLKPSELFQWVFLERAAEELNVIFAKGQELFQEQSYAPYLSDLGLSRRSPYSATANPSIHYWCNAAASLMGITQSQKARITHDGDLSGATVSAMVFAYASMKCRLRCRILPKSDILVREMVAEGNAPRDTGQMPEAFEAAQWYQYLTEKSFVVDPEISKYCLSKLRADVRDGSVGAKLAELIPK
ncbi:hypothetical protein HPB52_014801 [Rhipicephalus sanguineus]|uniref:Rhabdovirus nucleocapsid domain-containing protein n=1 Tax=Rhipicephalus sanguineus TaxID=34632 RepID=A0A9D4SSL4_RHISA|nr:hypothetical protein HPB52_014801 [Rhipicephalus sanguineus]